MSMGLGMKLNRRIDIDVRPARGILARLAAPPLEGTCVIDERGNHYVGSIGRDRSAHIVMYGSDLKALDSAVRVCSAALEGDGRGPVPVYSSDTAIADRYVGNVIPVRDVHVLRNSGEPTDLQRFKGYVDTVTKAA